MRERPVFMAVGLALALATGPLATRNHAPHAPAAVKGGFAVTTYRNDNGHTGQYSNETILNTSNVNVSQFGKRVSYPVDGQLYAQPLYVPQLTIGGKVHDVVFAATENDSVYALSADQAKTVRPLWKRRLLPPGATPVPYTAVNCGDLQPVIGITSTPVIDTLTKTMFVVTYDLEKGNFVYRLHALDMTTGADESPPIVIRGSVPGTGAGSSGGRITFDPQLERQRAALVLANGKVYVAFASFCDGGNYHGWIFSYSYNGSSFQRVNIYNDTPNGSQGGIWGPGAALDAGSTGDLYYMSGNGTFDANTGGSDMGDSFVRLSPSLKRQDYFTPFNQSCLAAGDQDLGSGGPLLIQSAHVLIGAGKEGRPYVVSTNSMGGFTPDPTLDCGTSEVNRTDIDKIQQELPPGTVGPVFSTPAFWNGPSGQYVYMTGVNGPTEAFSWSNGQLSTAPTSTTSANGGDPVVSSDGTKQGTGIVWNLDSSATLHAYDAANLSDELYNSNQDPGRDGLSGYVKFTSVAVADGKVFVGLASSLAIFGPISSGPPSAVEINSGGPVVGSFAPDEDFSGGLATGTTNTVDLSGVTNPAPEAVYQSNRFGNFTYTIPGFTPGATYTVRLHFAETYWTTPGSRIFNVSINGNQVLTDFDIIAAAGGPDKAVVEQFTVPADSTGKFTIVFTSVKDNAQVNGIEIDP